MDISKCKRILVVGDAGRGKSTLAKKLSVKLDLRHIELDAFFWVKKFTIRRDRDEQDEMVRKALKNEKEWVIEGTTRNMITLCVKSADCIFHLVYKDLPLQWFQIIKRGIRRKDSLKATFLLCKHVFNKKYGLGSSKGKKSIKKILNPYSQKVITLKSWKEINSFTENITKPIFLSQTQTS